MSEELNTITIEDFQNLSRMGENPIEGKLYRIEDSPAPPLGSIKVGGIVAALRCVDVDPEAEREPSCIPAVVERLTLIESVKQEPETEQRPGVAFTQWGHAFDSGILGSGNAQCIQCGCMEYEDDVAKLCQDSVIIDDLELRMEAAVKVLKEMKDV